MTPSDDLRWLFRYDAEMVHPALRAETRSPHMSVSDAFMAAQVQVHAPDLVSFPFLSERFVAFLLRLGDQVGRWSREPGDSYAAPELRLRKISPGLEDVLSSVIERHANPVMRRLYLGCYEAGWMVPPFLVRYDMHTQQQMGLHYDAESEVTLAVALNTQFEGGHLAFPRQGFCSRRVPVGHALMFPGGPSHPHEALPITAGERRALTIWTRRVAPPSPP